MDLLRAVPCKRAYRRTISLARCWYAKGILTLQGTIILNISCHDDISQGEISASSRPPCSSVSFNREERKEVVDVSPPWGSYLTGIGSSSVYLTQSLYYGILRLYLLSNFSTPRGNVISAVRLRQTKLVIVLTVSSTVWYSALTLQCQRSNARQGWICLLWRAWYFSVLIYAVCDRSL